MKKPRFSTEDLDYEYSDLFWQENKEYDAVATIAIVVLSRRLVDDAGDIKKALMASSYAFHVEDGSVAREIPNFACGIQLPELDEHANSNHKINKVKGIYEALIPYALFHSHGCQEVLVYQETQQVEAIHELKQKGYGAVADFLFSWWPEEEEAEDDDDDGSILA
jgi:hypothetical protein